MITEQTENTVSKNKLGISDLPALSGVSSTNRVKCNHKDIAKILQQFRCRDVKATFARQVSATRTTTYFFKLDKRRLNDVVRIDNTMARILELALKTSSVSILAPVPDSSQIAVIVPKKECEPVRLSKFIADIEQNNYSVPFVLGEDLVKQQDIEEWLNKKYPNRSWQTEFVYYPFLFGRVRKGWRKYTILYDLTSGSFVTKLNKLHSVRIPDCLQGLDGELEVFALLRDSRLRIVFAQDLATQNGQTQQKIQASVMKLIEKGLIGSGPKGLFVREPFKRCQDC